MKRGLRFLQTARPPPFTAALYFAISKWGIRHETVGSIRRCAAAAGLRHLVVRRDYEMKAEDGFWKLPVAIISNGNTVKNN